MLAEKLFATVFRVKSSVTKAVIIKSDTKT